MFEIIKKFHFEAGHQLTHHDGKCRNPHGHSYILLLALQSEELVPSGSKKNMVIDFADISEVVTPMIKEYFDHKWLNDTLETESPTSEYITKWIFEYLQPKLPLLHSVSLQETESSKVIYRMTN